MSGVSESYCATIAIPTRGRPDRLAALLPRVIAQLSSGVEVLIVDDDPAGYAASIAARFRGAPVRVVRSVGGGGLVAARNRCVAEAKGTWLIFLDDDQLPRAGWLAAMLAGRRPGLAAAFGRVACSLEADPPTGLETIARAIFSRELDLAADSDPSAHWPSLGAGNSMFHRPALPGPNPFDPRFARAGGEDLHLLRRMTAKGVALAWLPDAAVDEQVPAERLTPAFLRRRRFVHGQLRVRLEATGGGPARSTKAAAICAAGAAQALLHGAAWAALAATAQPRAQRSAVLFWAGIGKVAWWRRLEGQYAE